MEWVLLAATGSLLVRLGMAVHECGLVRSKNASAALLRKAADLAVALLAFWAVGQAIVTPAVSEDGRRALLAWRSFFATPASGDAVIVATWVALATAIAGGSAAERSRFWPTLAVSAVLAAIVVPLALRWTMLDGWLAHRGFRDVAGAGAVHLVGGAFALASAVYVGPRTGKYNRDGSANAIPGHSVPLASVGVALMALAWLLYVAGGAAAQGASLVDARLAIVPGLDGASAGARIPMNVLLAGSAGMLVSLLLCQARYGKPDVHLAYSGLIGALVAITAAADVSAAWKAVLIGAVAGVIAPLALLAIDLLWHIDDATGAAAVHGVGGLWGLVAAGLFASTPTFADKLKLLGWQALGIVTLLALAVAASVGTLALLKATVGLRAKEADEFDGLDLAEHDINAYPDFQQTMIKSYHLREA